MDAEHVLSRLDKVQSAGNRAWKACCPAHDDRNPSMRVTDKGDRILLHCFAGCDPHVIVASMGLQWSDMFVDGKERWSPVVRLNGNVALDESRMVMQMAQNKRESGESLTDYERQQEREAILQMNSEYAKWQEGRA